MEPKATRIRAAKNGDLDQVHRMQVQWAEEAITHGYRADSKENLSKRLGRYFLVAEVDGCVVGNVIGSARVSEGLAVIPARERYFEIEELYVMPEFRNRGIGGQLLQELLQIARLDGIDKFSVGSATKDVDRILRFYRNHGFESWFVQLFRR